MKENILEYMQRLNPSLDLNKAEFDVECAIDEVMNYCNISEFPAQLERIIAKYLVSNSETPHGVESITEGDTSIKYSSGYTNSIVEALRGQLNKFRRVGTL